MFSVHNTPEEFKIQPSPAILDLCLRKLGQGNHVIIVTSSLTKGSVFNRPHEHENPEFSNSSVLKSIFKWQAPFSWRISVDDRLNRRNKAVFSNFSGFIKWKSPLSWWISVDGRPDRRNKAAFSNRFSGAVWTLSGLKRCSVRGYKNQLDTKKWVSLLAMFLTLVPKQRMMTIVNHLGMLRRKFSLRTVVLFPCWSLDAGLYWAFSQFAHKSWKASLNLSSSVLCNPCQSSPSLFLYGLSLSLWCFSIVVNYYC